VHTRGDGGSAKSLMTVQRGLQAELCAGGGEQK